MLSNHHGDFGIGTIVGNDMHGTGHLLKVIKVIYVNDKDHYVLHTGYEKDNTFKAQSGNSLTLLTYDQISRSYPKKWTPEELSPVKGDILIGTDEDGTTGLFFFESTFMVHRLSEWKGSTASAASLRFYRENFPDLKVLKSSQGQKFHKLVA